MPLGRRISRRLPSLARALAVCGAVALAAVLVALLNGPWLRVTDVAWAGQHYTDPAQLGQVLSAQRGASVLAVDTQRLRERLERLPPVAEASVGVSVTGRVEATIVEHQAAFVWHTASERFLGAGDGTIFATLPRDEELSAELGALPQVRDDRFVARLITVGDRISEGVLRTALRLIELEPARLGSTATHLALRIDDEFGFRLVSTGPEWEVALGVYGLDPAETPAMADARLERQVTAVRTLFSTRAETEIGWVDVRNPGKVYFRAKG